MTPVVGGGVPEDADPAPAAAVPAASPWKPLVLAGLIIACVLVVTLTPLRDYARPTGIDQARAKVAELGAWAPAAFLVFSAIGVAIGVPRLALAALGGVLFGFILGTVIAQFGTLAGSWATFVVARHLGRDYIASKVRRHIPRVAALLDMLGRHPFVANVLLRASPVGNCFFTNLLMAISAMSLGAFLLGTFVGTLPETAIVALAASAAKGEDAGWRLVTAAVSLAVLGLGVAWWTRRTRLARESAT